MRYVVKSGDNLWNISKKYLKKGSKWERIYKYNISTIGLNPDIIHEGMELKIPKYRTYRHCLKQEVDFIGEMVASGNEGYLNKLFHLQDELIAIDMFRFMITSVVLIVLFILLS